MFSALGRKFVCFRAQMVVENELQKQICKTGLNFNKQKGKWTRNIWVYRALLYIGSPFLYHKMRVLGKWIKPVKDERPTWQSQENTLIFCLSTTMYLFFFLIVLNDVILQHCSCLNISQSSETASLEPWNEYFLFKIPHVNIQHLFLQQKI